MKRQGEKQISKDDRDEIDDDEEQEAGIFQRAAPDVLSQRKIVKVKRTAPAGDQSNLAEQLNPFKNSNPFSNLNSGNTLMGAPASNPFSGFKGLTSSVVTPVEIPSKLTSPIQETKELDFNFPTKLTNSGQNTSNSKNPIDTEFQKKISKLNKSFLSWMEKQAQENPLALWTDGVKDYIKYSTEIFEKYGSQNVPNISETSKSHIQATSVPTTATIIPSNSMFSSSTAGASSVAKASAPLATPTTSPPLFQTNSFNPPAATPSAPAFSFGALGAPPSSSSAGSSASTGFGGFSSFTLPGSTAASTTAAVATTTPSFSSSAFKFGSGLPFGSFSSTGTASGVGAPASGVSNGTTQPPKPTSGQLSWGSFAPAAGPTATGDGGDDGDGEGEGEGEPILAPEVILKNEADKDEILHDVPCKLFRFEKSDNEWKESGKGTFRITRDPETAKCRILVRNAMGKITLNSPFYKGMKFEKVKNGISFNAVMGANAELKTIMTKLKSEDVDVTLNHLNKCVGSL